MQVFFALLRFDIPLNAQIEYRGTIFIIFRFDKFRLNNEHYIIRSCAFQTNCSHFGYFTEIQLIIISIVVQILVEEQNGYSVRIYNDIKKKTHSSFYSAFVQIYSQNCYRFWRAYAKHTKYKSTQEFQRHNNNGLSCMRLAELLLCERRK